MTILTDSGIAVAMESGDVVIDPFDNRQIGSDTYDVRLGPWYYRESCLTVGAVYRVDCEDDVRKVWGEPIYTESEILLAPGETILAHTMEFVGTKSLYTTRMSARSSIGRSMIGVCKCAGRGDIGFFNRWTMEITSFSRFNTIALRVGMRVAQIEFMTAGKTEKQYNTRGKYQTSKDLEEMKRTWRPEMMLPRLYLDWELR